ncbi:MAG: tetratricopeptide repeat protein [Patescibacteria group bacterium]|jgi:tetratricopeptide (TPR) repeat protein
MTKKIKLQLINWQELRSWRPYFILVVLGFVLYSQILSFDLTYLDDNTLIIDNWEIISNLRNIPLAFSSDAFFSGTNFYYRPLLNVSFMLDALWGQGTFWVYFLSNLLLHLVTACLVFLSLTKLNTRRPLAFLLALIFLVHPAISQAVAWLPGRNDSLVTLFSVLSLLALFKFAARPRLGSLLAYAGWFALALFTKETVIFLPVLALVYFLTIGKKPDSQKTEKLLVLLLSILVGTIWLVMRRLAFVQENILFSQALKSLGDNLSAAVILAGKLILPVNLSVLPVPADTTFLWSLLAIIILVVALVKSKKINYPRFIFGLAWFLIFLLPPFIISSAAPFILEHRLYLPLIGFLIMISEIEFIKELNFRKTGVKLGAGLILLILAIITFTHSQNFSNRLTFWQRAVADSPHSELAQKNMGAMYYLAGDFQLAKEHYELALKLNPDEPMVYNNLGLIYFNLGELELAEEYFKLELARYPHYDKALANLGQLYYQQEKFIAAKNLFEQALYYNPYQAEVQQLLAETIKQISDAPVADDF